MKKISILLFALVVLLEGCKTEETTAVDPAADAQTAIEAKFKSIGWDKDGHAPFNGTGAVKTQAGKGYVQYYAFGGRKTAIYYYPDYGTFSMDTAEMAGYDNAGQDKFAFVVSDPKSCGTGCGYNDVIMTADNSEGINVGGNWVYGEIYKKYKAVNRWDGPLGVPVNSESNAQTAGSRFNNFAKTGSTVTGTIISNGQTGAQAVWGKTYTMWGRTNWDAGWLGLPKSSCDPNKADNQQTVDFQSGSIKTGPTCGAYFNKNNETVYQNGTRAANVSSIPCYNL
ncbi:LGFP repeat-containing protein [Runella aurantiaca]|uniref:Uncharacterized protein n=1 Tax=Runella aurantiaca TaxID=2282308 RepID=A0A369I8E5_9BACT|nr:hypothetical protein [Runella aurantiaca]RDB03424.1 hypothetical protein DVG78_24070 [Runella aurantiaca]